MTDGSIERLITAITMPIILNTELKFKFIKPPVSYRLKNPSLPVSLSRLSYDSVSQKAQEDYPVIFVNFRIAVRYDHFTASVYSGDDDAVMKIQLRYRSIQYVHVRSGDDLHKLSLSFDKL